jgi:hypothetical protein
MGLLGIQGGSSMKLRSLLPIVAAAVLVRFPCPAADAVESLFDGEAGTAPAAASNQGLPAFALSTLAAGEGEKPFKNIEGSFAIGVLMPGEVTLENGYEVDVDTDAGFIVRPSLDYFFTEQVLSQGLFFRFGLGGYLQAAFTGFDQGDDFTMVELGPVLKARFSAPIDDQMTFHFTPGLAIGYRRILLDDLDDVNGMAINLGFDLRLQWNQVEFSLEPGFITQPVGGNGDFDLTFGPIPYLLFGVGFAF